MPKKTTKTSDTKTGKEQLVSRESNLAEVVFKYPKTVEILLDYGLHCVGCAAMSYDTIEAGARIHGFNSEEIDELVVRINEVIEFDE
jgi:hybrid cluster-associated redox disulfide protein